MSGSSQGANGSRADGRSSGQRAIAGGAKCQPNSPAQGSIATRTNQMAPWACPPTRCASKHSGTPRAATCLKATPVAGKIPPTWSTQTAPPPNATNMSTQSTSGAVATIMRHRCRRPLITRIPTGCTDCRPLSAPAYRRRHNRRTGMLPVDQPAGRTDDGDGQHLRLWARRQNDCPITAVTGWPVAIIQTVASTTTSSTTNNNSSSSKIRAAGSVQLLQRSSVRTPAWQIPAHHPVRSLRLYGRRRRPSSFA